MRTVGPPRRVGLIAASVAVALSATLALSSCGSSHHPTAGAVTVPAAKGATGGATSGTSPAAGSSPAVGGTGAGGASSATMTPGSTGASHGGVVTPSGGSAAGGAAAGGAAAGGAAAGGAAAGGAAAGVGKGGPGGAAPTSGSGTATAPTTAADTQDGSEPKSPAPTVIDPCSLVTGAEAQSILGAPVSAPISAPLGPTCVYRTTGGSAMVTVSVQVLDVAQVTPLMQNVAVVQEAGHATYCGMYGQPTLLVSLDQRTALDIVAACPVAQKFAAVALPRLH